MEQKQQDPFLFIYLGLDTLYSINLNHLLLKKEEEEDLRIVFSHETNKQPVSGNPYPLGMGLFVHNSKLHFFGGENIINNVVDTDYSDDELDNNKKVFSFSPIFKSDEPALNLVSITEEDEDNNNNESSSIPLIPEQISQVSMRPIVFTISNRVYALATAPFDGILTKQNVFEVFEPCNNINNNGIIKWQWTKLPNPPLEYLECVSSSIYPTGLPIFHCVIKNQLLLQTPTGDYIFDLILREWFKIPFREHDIVLASLEYKDHVLLFRQGGYLVAYDFKSFKEYKEEDYYSYWKPSFGAVREHLIYTSEDGAVHAATLSIVDDNSICLVFNSSEHLYICHLEFIRPPCVVGLKAYKEIHLPLVLRRADPYTLSSFILREGDAEKSNQDSTTGSLHLEGEAEQIPFEEEMERRALEKGEVD